ncbi:MAG TPA: hypothetical protein VFO85_21705 [Vicinamibacteria bacterium]|nr:hypothetical protein [Vicinamibacteria bacterium]
MRAVLAVLLLMGPALPAAAQSPRAPSPPPPDVAPWGGHFRLSGAVFDNFFQTPEGEPQEDVPAAGMEAGLHKGFSPHLLGYAEVDYTDYRRYRPSGGISAGLRREGRPHAFDVQGQVMLGRPSREVADEFDRADGVAVVGQYGYRMGDWEPLALAEVRRETYERSPQKANTVLNVGAGLRFRGLGTLSPEVGFRMGTRDVRDDEEDLGQREVYLRLRWAPARPTYLTLRVRRRFRDYSVDDPAARNFGREDTRTQAVATADLRTTSRLGFNLYYSVEDSSSTHERGEFLTQMLAAGIVLRF